MARVKYYDSTTQTWKYADMALQTGIHVGTTAPTNEAMLWVDTASNQIDDFPLTDVKDGDGNSLIASGTTYAVTETPSNKLKSVSGGGAGITSASTDTEYPSAKAVYDFVESQGGGGGIDYSTTEQDTGLKWIDGKSIYQKTYQGSTNAAYADSNVEIDDFTGKNFLNGYGYCGQYGDSSGKIRVAIPCYLGVNFFCGLYTNDNSLLQLYYSQGLANSSYVITVFYTKD